MAESAPIEARLAEYAALRQEIQNRSGLQQTLIGLNVTAIGALVGLVLSTKASSSALLILPPICTTLAFLWIDHHRVIREIGLYIVEEVWAWIPSWQLAHGRGRNSGWFWVPIGLIWITPSVGALIAAPLSSQLHSQWWLWAADAVLVGLFVAFFIKIVVSDVQTIHGRLIQSG